MSAQRLDGHRLSVLVPPGWDARIGATDDAATLHAASFALPAEDGEFGTRATGTMPPESMFLAITEYVPDRHLRPGRGLFAGTRPSQLQEGHFAPETLLLARPGQRGAQWFFSDAGRPFCLYAVLHTHTRTAQLLELASACVRSLDVAAP